MTIEKVVCDECGRVRAEANHWHRIVVWKNQADAFVSATVGPLVERLEAPSLKAEVHDICGQECFHKHIAKLMGFTEERQAQNVS